MVTAYMYGEKAMTAYKWLALFMVSSVLILAFPLGIVADRSNPVSEIFVPVGVSIQEAINNAAEGDTIIIQNGVHIEEQYPIFVNKSVTLLGENVAQSIVDADGTTVGIFLVSASNSRISGVTVQNTSQSASGIHLAHVVNVEISNCTITGCPTGIQLTDSTSGNITMNQIVSNLGPGIYMHTSSSYNKIVGNNITDNPVGVQISDMACQDNLFYYNNFISNAVHQNDIGFNSWNGTYPVGGNYWSNYTSVDLMNGGGQNVAGSDGIADSAYQDLDWYPLVKPIYFFHMYNWNVKDYYAVIATNSTVSSLRFDPSLGTYMNFSVVGDDETTGCCRVAIPKGALWVDDLSHWTIVLNETALTAGPLIVEDADNTYFYFTYDHSTQVVRIIGTHIVPEFSLHVMLALLALFAGMFLLEKKTRRSLL